MPDCEKYQELISRMIDSELDEAEKAELAAHVASCPDCGRLYAAFSSVSEAIKNDLEEPPAALKEQVMAAVADKRKNVISIRRRGRLIALAACLTLVIAGSASLGIFSRKGAASLTAARAPTDTTAEFGTDAEEKDQLVTSNQATNAVVDQAPKKFIRSATAEPGTNAEGKNQPVTSSEAPNAAERVPENIVQPAAANTAYLSSPDGDYQTSDADVISRLSALLSSSGESAAPGSNQSTAENYTVSLPGQDSISVTVDGDKLICKKVTGGDWFSASGSVSDFLALLNKMNPVN